MNKKEERLNNLISILQTNNGASVKQLAAKMKVSEMTIRRDLKILEEKNIVDSYYGAVVYNPKEDNPITNTIDTDISDIYDIHSSSRINENEKNIIGKAAAKLVEEDDFIIIDTGSTTEKLSQYIPDDLRFSVLVFGVNNLIHMVCKENADIVVAGGNYHRDTGMFESSEGLATIDKTRASKVFISAAGVHERLGLTCEQQYEVETKKHIINNSLKVILLVDSSKFGKVKSAYFCDLDKVHTVVTDKGISDEWRQRIIDMNIELIIAE